MLLKEFLQAVVTADEPGYFCLALSGNHGAGWLEEWHKWPEDIDVIVKRAQASAETANVYFSSYLFKAPQSTIENVLPSRTIQADLDDADVTTLPKDPSILVETSPGRHQGYWILDKALSLEDHQALSRKITYSIPLCDRSGWPLGRKVRVPSTLNHKYSTGPKTVHVLKNTSTKYSTEEFEALPEVPQFLLDHYDAKFLDSPEDVGVHPLELLERIKDAIPVKIYVQFSSRQEDRSEALWALLCWAFKAGLDRAQVFTLAKGSENNKFADQTHRGDQDLAKDVLRAEHAVRSNIQDPKKIIQDLYKTLAGIERKRAIYNVVLTAMKQQGEFLHNSSGMGWYIRKDVGRPIAVSAHSELLQTMLDMQYGLNFTEPESRYVAHGLRAYISSLPDTSMQSALSHYDLMEKHLLVHTGRRTVLRVTAAAIDHMVDGAYGIVFPWAPSVEAFTPVFDKDIDWGAELFRNGTRGFGSSVDNITNMTPDQATALLKVWLMFVLFRNVANTRPIIATFGQPGCLSGDTPIEYKYDTDRVRVRTLAKMYESFCTYEGRLEFKILSLKDGIIRWRTVHKVIKSGQKETWTISVQGQESFRATKDHRFLTSKGYKCLADLRVGDSVLTKGNSVSTAKPPGKSGRRQTVAKYHPHAWTYQFTSASGYGPYEVRKIMRSRASLDAHLNGLSLQEFLFIVNKNEPRAATLKYLPKEVHIHHKDENPANDDPSNLAATTQSIHLSEHSSSETRNRGAYNGAFSAVEAPIVSIEKYGLEETYDIQMEDSSAPNFLVSDTVVHNSGKTSLFKKMYALLYGRGKSLSAVTTMDDFDHATSTDPLVVLDNVDTWEKWLPDRIALSAGTSDVVKRKLYTDSDTITLKRQAIVAVTAHNPKFGREDVADRFLLFSYQRLEHFVSEELILADVVKKRNVIWGAILRDAQKILRSSVPLTNIPQFRIEDFARFGLWIARALDCEDDFRAAIEDVKVAQQSFSLEEEGLLVSAVNKFVARKAAEPKFYTTSQLWAMLESVSDDPKTFSNIYRNSVILSKKLSSMQASLRKIIRIEQSINEAGARTWLIALKETPQENDNASS